MNLEEERKKLYREYKLCLILGFSLLIVLFGVYFLGRALMIKERYIKKWKEHVIGTILNEMYPKAKYSIGGEVTAGDVNGAGLIRYPDEFIATDSMVGRYKGIKFRVSDCVLKSSVGSNQIKIKTDYQNGSNVKNLIFCGRWFVYEFEKDLGQIIRIREKEVGIQGLMITNMEKCFVESIKFEEKFLLFATNPQEMYYIMTPKVINGMLELEDKNKGKIMFAFCGNKLHVGINDGIDNYEPRFDEPIDGKAIIKCRSQLKTIGDIVDLIGLDDTRFKDIYMIF